MWVLALLLAGGISLAQGETDIYLISVEPQSDSLQLGIPENITRNPGYDNQPAFTPEGKLLYSRTRDGQTDIAAYDPGTAATEWITDTPGGSEYSPLPIPGSKDYSAIRLDTNGLQRLYRYKNGKPKLLVPDQKIGYQVWVNPELLVCTVLVEGGMDLVVIGPAGGSVYTFQKNVGRSLQRIPGSDRISFVALESGEAVLQSMDPVSGATSAITPLPEGVQDVVWLSGTTLLCGKGNQIMRWDAEEEAGWRPVYRMPQDTGDISRMALSPEGNLLALVIAPER